jgi:hypothetical protein
MERKMRAGILPARLMAIITIQGQLCRGFMKLRRIVCVLVFFGALVRFGPVQAEDSFPGAEWERATLTESGWSEAGLAQARAFSDQLRSSAVMIVQHGKVVAEWGRYD